MRISNISLQNFRNYEQCSLVLSDGCNILVGENAQGKSNLLEAVELLATGRSSRADKDEDLIRFHAQAMTCQLAFAANGQSQELKVSLAKVPTGSAFKGQTGTKIEKRISINGVMQKSLSDLIGRLLVVSFAASDLNLLRGGPRHRREWLDGLILKLKPRLYETYTNYSRCVAQRNRLLKAIFEKGKVTVSDQDQLLIWDKQVAELGAVLIKQRLRLLSELLPIAESEQSRISRNHETLSIRYYFKAPEQVSTGAGSGFGDSGEDEDDSATTLGAMPELDASGLASVSEQELAQTLMRLLKARRAEEIRRKQTTVGPHRDDLIVHLNGADALSFASQGQQRSIVLSLKMAELSLLKQSANDTAVFLLDDVLAELDEFRQSMLMSAVESGLQTIITTTHLSGFDPRWLENATIFKVHGGAIDDPALV
jgi:DNA replication and repair protein RecF